MFSTKLLKWKFKIVGCQHQEDGLQRKRVAQRTYCVREHTQAFDGGHIRRRIHFVSIIIVITVRDFEPPIKVVRICSLDSSLTPAPDTQSLQSLAALIVIKTLPVST